MYLYVLYQVALNKSIESLIFSSFFGEQAKSFLPPTPSTFCPRANWKSRHTVRISLRAEPQKEKCPFHFRKSPPPRKSEKARNIFFLGLPSEARRWRGFRGAYDSIQNHHALRAWHIVSDFGNRCELGTIKTPKQNSTAFSKPNGGTREARPTDFPPFFQTNSDSRLRRDGLFFRQEAGANQKQFWLIVFALIQKRIFAILNLRPHSDCLF